MIREEIKTKIQMYICDDLTGEKRLSVEKLISESEEVKEYYLKSREVWDNLENIDEISPSERYVSDFWKKADEKENTGFDPFFFLKNHWKLAGSFAVFMIAAAFLINSYNYSNTQEFVISSDDEEILNQLDNAITLNGDSALEVYGPW